MELDAVNAENLPEVDCCIIRQACQHLSNAQIMAILEKVNKYKFVIITEHVPLKPIKKNLDKLHGPDIRLYQGSGMFVEAKPLTSSVIYCLNTEVI